MAVLDHWHPVLPSRMLKRQPVVVRLAGQEIVLFRTVAGTVGALEGLVDKNPAVEGMKLSRFDRVLGLNRERIERIYRGNA